MDFNLVTALESCYSFNQENPDIVRLVYYSHIPTALFALLFGAFIFFKDRRSLVSKILLGLSSSFALWTTCDFFTWISSDSRLTMTAWSMLGIFNILVFLLSLYLISVFPDDKDVSWKWKLFFGVLILPVIFLTPTSLSVSYFDVVNCEATDGSLFLNYYYGLSVFIAIFIAVVAGLKLRNKLNRPFKKQILLLTVGVELFLFLFGATGIIASLIDYYKFEFYGLFGMTIFLGFLAYLIVKFKAFNIKLLGAQALVISLVGLVAAEFFFTPLDNTTNIILISVTVLLSTIFGIVLVNSVKKEAQRKEELQQMSDKLAEANDQLRKLDNAKSEFISIASHQLRTPLTAIKGFVSLLLEGSYGKVEAKQEDVLNKVYTSNDRLINLVEDLLNISRIESGRMEFKLAPTRIEDLCQEVADTLMMKAKGRKLYLDYQLPKVALPELMIDGTKVREVISNMVDNAVKYTEKGGVSMRIEKTDDVVRVIVSDTGIGIPKEELPYLFSKFSRGKDTARLNTGGTGLGLYVGKAMIEQNGGRIWAESDGAGRGSRFIIELPVAQDKELLKRWGQA